MKTEDCVQILDKRVVEMVAIFGTARLLKTGQMGYRLVGGFGG